MPDWSISSGGASVAVHPGDIVTFGRSPSCDLTIADGDNLVSRHAGTVIVGKDHLEVLNTSSAQRFLLIPNVGPQIVVRVDGSATSRGMPVFSIVITGKDNAEYVIDVVGPGTIPPTTRAASDGEAPTVIRPFELSVAESAVVKALCRPMLLGRGKAAVPATYQAAADALQLVPGTVRNRVKQIRDRAAEHGIPGLGGEGQPVADDFRLPFCEFAIANGWAYGDD